MGKLPSDATKLRTLKRELARLDRNYSIAISERNQAWLRINSLTKELFEYKERFDALLQLRKTDEWK